MDTSFFRGNSFTTEETFTLKPSYGEKSYPLSTAREWDSENSTYYYRARQYNPYVGRFIARDPIEYWDGINLYVYTHNSPDHKFDPFGLNDTEACPGKANVAPCSVASLTVEFGRLVTPDNPWYGGGGTIASGYQVPFIVLASFSNLTASSVYWLKQYVKGEWSYRTWLGGVAKEKTGSGIGPPGTGTYVEDRTPQTQEKEGGKAPMALWDAPGFPSGFLRKRNLPANFFASFYAMAYCDGDIKTIYYVVTISVDIEDSKIKAYCTSNIVQ